MINLNSSGSSGSVIADALIGPRLDYRQRVLVGWRNGYITEVSNVDLAKRSESNCPIFDGLLIPGLIDSHVHLGLSGSGDVVGDLQGVTEDVIRNRINSSRKAYLRAGITTVRDLGCPFSLLSGDRELIHESSELTSVIAAQAISSATGHGNFVSRHSESLDGYKKILEDLDPQVTPFIKLFASGGVLTKGTNPDSVQMSQDLLEQIVSFAQNRGFLIAAHAHSRSSVRNALRAGVNTIEHFSYLDEYDLHEISVSSSWLVSTYVATKRFVSKAGQTFTEPEAWEKIRLHDPAESKSLRLSLAVSSKVIAGSDSGTILNPHPLGLLEQAEQMKIAGFSELEILSSMTVRAGQALGAKIGQISPGFAADFTLLEASPVKDLSALSRVKLVIKRGEVLAL
jgi:imidazolonepropionase-like amidohydrolase